MSLPDIVLLSTWIISPPHFVQIPIDGYEVTRCPLAAALVHVTPSFRNGQILTRDRPRSRDGGRSSAAARREWRPAARASPSSAKTIRSLRFCSVARSIGATSLVNHLLLLPATTKCSMS